MQSETSIRMSRGTGLLRVATQKLSRLFLKTFAAVFPDPTDGPQVSEDAADKEPNVHQKLRACKTLDHSSRESRYVVTSNLQVHFFPKRDKSFGT